MYINFQQNRANTSVITGHTNVFAKKSQVAYICNVIANCINLPLAIRISKKSCLSDMHYPITDIQADFEMNRLAR